MHTPTPVSFQEAIEIIESFPPEQQQSLIEIIQNRLTESKRDEIAGNIKQTREAYQRGEARTGSVDDIMEEIEW